MRLLHSFLLWLMMLALPVQGFAAASMLYCGTDSSHHAVQMQPMPESHHEAGASTQMHHAMGATDDGVKMLGDTAYQVKDISTKLPDAAHKCGVCASCCNLIAIADVRVPITASATPPTQYLEPLVQAYAAPSRLLDKPPRS